MKITESMLRKIIKAKLSERLERDTIIDDDEEAEEVEEEPTFDIGAALSGPNATAVSYTPSGPEKRVNPNAKLNQMQVNAWRWLSPLLPDGARLTSGFRTQEDQDQIIRNYANSNNVTGNLDTMHKELKKKGFVIARKAGVGHGSGEAIDISGAGLQDIKRAVEAVTRDTEIPVTFAAFSGTRYPSIVEPANNAVHVHILSAAPVNEELRSLIIDKWSDIGPAGGGMD